MRYIFDTSSPSGQYNIKMTIQANNGGQSSLAERIVFSLNSDPNTFKTQANCKSDIESILKDALDNIRLTVSEREEAINDLEKFLSYIRNLYLADILKPNVDDVIINEPTIEQIINEDEKDKETIDE